MGPDLPRGARLVGVYDADGGLVGEASYVVGKALGRRHCSLCDITHSPVRRKREWDALVARLPVPLQLLHRNEVPDALAAVACASLPAVFLLAPDTAPALVLGPEALEECGGSVEAFEARLRAALVHP